MNKPFAPTLDALEARKRRRRLNAIPRIYQQDYEQPEDDWRDVISVDFERSAIDFDNWY